MKTKQVLSWFSLVLGEALIITTFILFRGDSSDNILALNIIVSTIIYGLFFIDILIPWIDFSDKSEKKIGALGIRWLTTWLYTIAAIAAMIIGNVTLDLVLSTQIIIHGILIFFLLLGFVATINSSDRVEKVYLQEMMNRNGINEMKSAIRSLKDKMNNSTELPEYFVNRINTLEENIRFISPSDNPEAFNLEQSLIETLSDISLSISHFSMNEESIENRLRRCEQLYQNRKNIYSK